MNYLLVLTKLGKETSLYLKEANNNEIRIKLFNVAINDNFTFRKLDTRVILFGDYIILDKDYLFTIIFGKFINFSDNELENLL